MSLKPDKLMSADEWMKLTQDGDEDLQHKQAADIAISEEGQSVAVNITTDGPSASDFRKGHKQDISVYASCNGDRRYWFCVKRNWLPIFLMMVSPT